MKRLMMLLTICEVLSACAGIERPNADICGINAVEMKLRCYNAKTDYDDDGNRKAGAKPVEHKISSLKDLNGWTAVSPTSLKNIKIFAADVRDELTKRCQ